MSRISESTLGRLLAFVWPYKWLTLLTVLLGVGTIGSSLGLMGTAGYLLSLTALRDPTLPAIWVAIAAVRLFGLARPAFRYAEQYVSHSVTFRVLAHLRTWFYTRLEPLAPARLQQINLGRGDLLTRITADVDTLENFFGRVLEPTLVALLTALVSAGVLAYLSDWRAGLVLLITLALAGLGAPWLTHRLSREPGQRLTQIRAELNGALVDGIQGTAELLVYGGGDAYARRVARLSRELSQVQERLAVIRGLGNGLLSLLTFAAVALLLVLTIPQAEPILLATLALITLAAFEAVNPLPLAYQHLTISLSAAQRILALVDAQPLVPETGAALPPAAGAAPPALRVENLSFRYGPEDVWALREVSFSVPPGGRVAIVGPSGAGKSTLFNLLLRFWPYTDGEIWLGEQELRALSPTAVRDRMAVVSQETYLFQTTIGDNLRVARPGASPEALDAAVQSAQLTPFLRSLPDGYETLAGEQGQLISGGERQRLAIARALLRDAPVLLLDEPTANLDAVTEQALQAALQTAMRGRTTLLITHRLVGLEGYDRILVLDGGRVVQSGSHGELVSQPGLYRQMWWAQRLT